jgi:hypothetical protein
MPVRKLNARFVETVSTTEPRVEFRDTGEEGLELRVTKSGVKTWAFRYRRRSDSKKRFVTFGRYPEMRLAEARVRAQEERARVSRGADPAAGIQERKMVSTFREVATEWQTNHAELNRSGQVRGDDCSILKLYVLPVIGDMKVTDISRRDISLMLSEVRKAIDRRKGHNKRGDAPRRLTHRANAVFALVRSIMRWALGQGIITMDPTYGMKKPIKKETVRDRELSPVEIAMFWRNIDGLPTTPALQIAMKLSGRGTPDYAVALKCRRFCAYHDAATRR